MWGSTLPRPPGDNLQPVFRKLLLAATWDITAVAWAFLIGRAAILVAADSSRVLVRLLLLTLAMSCLVTSGSGCARQRYRLSADKDAYRLISQKSKDPRWALHNFDVYVDPRSRFYDPYDPDRNPMPADDPTSHQLMHCIDGKKGYPRWHEFGDRPELESPYWRELLGEYVQITDSGALRLDVNAAVDVAIINSPDYRKEMEDLYLSALDVSTERFRFETQFYGGVGTFFEHIGRNIAGGTTSDSLDVTTSGILQKRFATGGEMLVGFANSIVWQFAGSDSNTNFTILNFNLIQPLLRAGGRAVVLERLTLAERALLSNVRAWERYRQGFYTGVAIGANDTTGPQRLGGFFGGTGLTGFTGQGSGGFGEVGTATGLGRGGIGVTSGGGGSGAGAGFAGGGAGTVGGFIGLLQTEQQIRNTRNSLDLQLRTLGLLEANLEAGLIDITQVDQFRQNIQTERATLLQSQIALQNAFDTFKRSTLGLPPNIEIELDDTMIRQFRLLDPQTTDYQSQLADFVTAIGNKQEEPTAASVLEALNHYAPLREGVARLFELTRADLQVMQASIPRRVDTLSAAEITQLQQRCTELSETVASLERRYQQTAAGLARLRESLPGANLDVALNELVAQAQQLVSLVQELSLSQAVARLEAVTIEPIELDAETALEIARTCRLDWMNNRAALVDSWRLIAFNANALLSNLTITLDGDVSTPGSNPLDFRAARGRMFAGVQFDPPFTRLLERNNYRQSLIDYQQDRRQLIQYEDAVMQTLRQDLRQLNQLAINLEIQRQAVAIAVRRVDQTAEVLNAPPAVALPGEPASQLGPTAALNLITALSDLRNSQNNFMSVWLNYYAQRMVLMRNLGVMELDEHGHWIDRPLSEVLSGLPMVEPLPPELPREWLEAEGITPEELLSPLDPPESRPSPARTAPDKATPDSAAPGRAAPGKASSSGEPLPLPEPPPPSAPTPPATRPATPPALQQPLELSGPQNVREAEAPRRATFRRY